MESCKRTAARALTWRILGFVWTFLLTWAMTGSMVLGAELGLVYNLTRFVMHYFHDRAWNRVAWGMEPGPNGKPSAPPARDPEGSEDPEVCYACGKALVSRAFRFGKATVHVDSAKKPGQCKV